MASDWIGTFKGPNVCAQRFSYIWLCLYARLVLVCEREIPLGSRVRCPLESKEMLHILKI